MKSTTQFLRTANGTQNLEVTSQKSGVDISKVCARQNRIPVTSRDCKFCHDMDCNYYATLRVTQCLETVPAMSRDCKFSAIEPKPWPSGSVTDFNMRQIYPILAPLYCARKPPV